MLFGVVGLEEFGEHILHGDDLVVEGVVFLDALDAGELVVGFDAVRLNADGGDYFAVVIGFPRAAKHLYYFINIKSFNNIK